MRKSCLVNCERNRRSSHVIASTFDSYVCSDEFVSWLSVIHLWPQAHVGVHVFCSEL